jgi:hypothetical protein
MPRKPDIGLYPGQHKLEGLARLVVKNSQIRGKYPTTLQKSALEDFRRVKLVPAGTSTYKIAKIYMPIFDRLFFFKSLRGRLHIIPTGKYSKKTYGWTEDTSNNKAKIVVNTSWEDGKTRVLKHIATTLHEMIHAFLLIYMLPYYRDERPSFYGDGYTGHGAAWQDIAYALETAVNDPRFLDLKLDLGRGTALRGEINKASELIDPARWGLDFRRKIPPGNDFCSRTVKPRQLSYKFQGARNPGAQGGPAKWPGNFVLQGMPAQLPKGWFMSMQFPPGQPFDQMRPNKSLGRPPIPAKRKHLDLESIREKMKKLIFGE